MFCTRLNIHWHNESQYYDQTYKYMTLVYNLVLRLIWKDQDLCRCKSNPQPLQLRCDCSTIKLPSPWEQGGLELGICIQVLLVPIWLIHQVSPKVTPGMTCCYLWLSFN